MCEGFLKKNSINDFVWVTGFILFFILLKTSVTSFYLVPTPSMLPNIIPGDRVMLNKLSYGLWLPFFDYPIITWSNPKRGDVVLFNSPNRQSIYVKRVMGIPGDIISFQKGFLYVNGKKVTRESITSHYLSDNKNNVIVEENKDLLLSPHLILMSVEPGNTYFEAGRFIVPPNKVFVLGDNRDSSVDSRFFGFVDKADLYGKAVFILFSTTGNNKIFPEFRMNRFFQKLE